MPFDGLGLIAGHQTQMAFADLQCGIAVHSADHRHVGVVFDDRAQLGFVTTAAELVEDHAGDVHLRGEGLIAEDQRCDAACHTLGVDDQDHWRVQQGGEGGVAVAAIEVKAIIEPLVALDEAEVGIATVALGGAQDLRPAHGVEIEIVTVATGGT